MIITAAFVVVLVGVGWLVRYLTRDYEVVKSWSLPGNREIVVKGARSWERNQPLVYDVIDKGQTRLHEQPLMINVFAYEGGYPSLDVVTTDSGDMAAIVWTRDPTVVLAIYDFRTGETCEYEMSHGNGLLLDRYNSESNSARFRFPKFSWERDFSK
jgi:hypothetical protein